MSNMDLQPPTVPTLKRKSFGDMPEQLPKRQAIPSPAESQPYEASRSFGSHPVGHMQCQELTMTQAQAETTSSAGPSQQQQSLFFSRLPQELRDYIYHEVFSTTELVFDDEPYRRPQQARSKSNTLRLAVLFTCHRARHEIGDSWIPRVWFSFRTMWDLLRILPAAPPRVLPLIRFLRTLCPGHAFDEHRPLDDYSENSYAWASLDAALNVLPGLRLDKLVVHGLSYQARGCDSHEYEILDRLIRQSDGWKELHYICSDSGFLAWGTDHENVNDQRREGPQPQHWQQALRKRDGLTSGASVTMYRSTHEDMAGSEPAGPGQEGGASAPKHRPERICWLDFGWITDDGERCLGYHHDLGCQCKRRLYGPSSRYDWVGESSAWCPMAGDCHRASKVRFEQEVPAGTRPEDYGFDEDESMEYGEGVHVIVKRGSNVDYTVKPGSPLVAFFDRLLADGAHLPDGHSRVRAFMNRPPLDEASLGRHRPNTLWGLDR